MNNDKYILAIDSFDKIFVNKNHLFISFSIFGNIYQRFIFPDLDNLEGFVLGLDILSKKLKIEF